MSSTSCMGANNSGFTQRGNSRLLFGKQLFKCVVFHWINISSDSLHLPLPPQTRCASECAHVAVHAWMHKHARARAHTINNVKGSPVWSPVGRDIVAVTKETRHNTFSSVSHRAHSINRQQLVWWCQASGGRGKSTLCASYLWTSLEGCWDPPHQAGRRSGHPPSCRYKYKITMLITCRCSTHTPGNHTNCVYVSYTVSVISD